MHQRVYYSNRKRFHKDGTPYISVQRFTKWIKSKTIQRKYRPRGQAKVLWSKRFGYLDVYTRKEQNDLICPSGYTFGQGMNKLRKLWYCYMKSKARSDITKMEYYARIIQKTQDDLGLKTTSFPHLGIYGDVLMFLDHKTGNPKIEIDHSELKEKQDMEEAKEKFAEIAPFIELQPDIEKGEELVTIEDEVPLPLPKPEPRYRVKHGNRMHYSKKRDEEWTCEKCDEIVPPGRNHICKLKEEEGSNVVTMTDDIPFM